MPQQKAQRAMKPARLALLDLLRFIAAMGVMFYHYVSPHYDIGWGAPSTQELFPILGKVSALGAFGVQAFFIVSGFVILMSAQGRTIPQFAASRISRLAPAYIFVVLISGILIPLVNSAFTGSKMREALVNLTLVQTAFGVPHVDGVYWTLWVELCFYVLIACFLFFGMTYGRIVAFAAAWPVAAQLTSGDGLFTLLIHSYAPFFAGGMALYLIYTYGHNLVNWGLLAFNAFLGIQTAKISTVPFIAKWTGIALNDWVLVAVILLIFATVAVAVLTPARSWAGTIGTELGKLTYPSYLIHVAWGYPVISYFSPRIGPYWTLLFVSLLVIGLAWLITRFVERPLHFRVKRWVLDPFNRVE